MNKQYNSGDPKQVKEQEDEQEFLQRQRLNDIRTILNTPEGVRFFREMFSYGHIETACFTGNSNTYYNLGLRDFALKYWNMVKEASPEIFTKIIIGDS